MGIAGGLVGHHVLPDLAGVRIEAADVARRVAGVPDDAVGVHDQVVGADAVGVVLGELLGLGIEDRDVGPGLADEPDAAVGGDVGIPGAGVLVGDHPFLEVGVPVLLGDDGGSRHEEREGDGGREGFHDEGAHGSSWAASDSATGRPAGPDNLTAWDLSRTYHGRPSCMRFVSIVFEHEARQRVGPSGRLATRARPE